MNTLSIPKILHRFRFLVAAACLYNAWADYPIMSHRYLADPAPLVSDGRVYVYCSNDDLNKVEGGYNIPSVVCVSSSDMKNWTDHGVVFDAARDTSWAKKAWAPTAVERGGKVFLYFGNGGSNIGVVAGTSALGPFVDVLKSPLITSATPGVLPAEKMWLFDPAAFIDDDGQAYLYFGGNGDDNARVVRLHRDMISLDGEALHLHVPHFFEASWMHKHDGVYYFSYSTTPSTGMRIDYLTSRSPISGFEYGGVLAQQPPENQNNNHAAEFLFKGSWYHVYHNRIVAKTEGIPTGFRRNLAIELLKYDSKGAIKPVEYSIDTLPQVGFIDPYTRVEGETFSACSRVKTEPCVTGGMNLAQLHDNDWIKVSGVNFGAKGTRRFSAEVASGSKGGVIELHLDSPEGQAIGRCRVSNTGGWQSWRTDSCDLPLVTGVHDVFLKFSGGEGLLMSLNYWKVTPAE